MMRRVMHRLPVSIFLVAVFITTQNVDVARAGPVYQVTDLGGQPTGNYFTIANDVNNFDQVVGISFFGDNLSGIVWDGTSGIREISTLGGAPYQEMFPSAINDAGQYAATSPFGAFRGSLTNGPQHLQPLPGDTGGTGFGINKFGVVVGSSAKTTHQAVIWTGNTPTPLVMPFGTTYSVGIDINDLGHVTGYLGTASGELPFFWSAETGTVVIPLLNATGYAINNLDQVVGGSGFIWDPIHGLNMLDGFSQALSINDSGVVVGWNSGAMIWDSVNGSRDLNDLIPSGLGRHLNIATSINNKGNITAWSSDGNSIHSYLLRKVDSKEVPEPSTIALIGMALLSLFGFGMMRHRQAQ